MTQQNDNKSNGFYGPDGEFYPASSSAAQSVSKSFVEEDGKLYPKRPNISYTTSPYTNPPAAPQNNDAALNDGAPDTKETVFTGSTKFCKFCGKKIPEDAVLCVHCGRQVEELRQAAPQPVIINNSNSNVNANVNTGVHGNPKNKWVSFFLCLFGGYLGLHRFYEGRIGLGILYIFTAGIFGIGWFIDIFRYLFKPNPYYV